MSICGLSVARLRIDRILQQIVEYLAQAGRLALDDDGCVRKRKGDVRAQIVVQSEHVEQERPDVDAPASGPGLGCRA